MALWHLLMRSGCRWAPPSQRLLLPKMSPFTWFKTWFKKMTQIPWSIWYIYIYTHHIVFYIYRGIFVTHVRRSLWILKNFSFNLRHIQVKQHLTLIDTPLFFAPAQALKVSHRKGPNSACLAMSLWLHMKERNLGRGPSKRRFPFHEEQVLGKRMLLKRQQFSWKNSETKAKSHLLQIGFPPSQQ